MPKKLKKLTLRARVEQCVNEKVKPLLELDGGSIEVVSLTPKKVLKVKFQGACHGCPCASMTLQYGVQNILNEEFPDEVIKVEAIDF